MFGDCSLAKAMSRSGRLMGINGELSPVESVLSRLQDVHGDWKGWLARCPAHDDRKASLSIGKGDDGRVFLNRFAGCDTEVIVKALGLSIADLFKQQHSHSSLRVQEMQRLN